MKQTLALLQKELEKEDYQLIIKQITSQDISFEKREELKKKAKDCFSLSKKTITETFIKEFNDSNDPVHDYIQFVEDFIPKQVGIRDLLIGELLDASSEGIFKTDKEATKFVKKVIENFELTKTNDMAIFVMGSSEVICQRTKRYVESMSKQKNSH
jgi:hypothetical protein